METQVNYTAVGAFVIALLAAIVITILWLSVGLTRVSYTPYLVYMNESVTGLNPESSVKFNGVNVGVVKTIELNPRDPQQVKILLDIKTGTPITEDTTAMLDTLGLTGVAYIDLQSKGTSNKPLQPPLDEPYPVIPNKPSIFLRLDTALSQLSNNFNQMSQQLQMLLGPDNQRAFSRTLNNIDQITGNTAKASQQFPAVLQTFEGQTLPALDQAINNLNGVTNNLLQISNEIKQNPSVLIRGKKPQQLGPGEK